MKVRINTARAMLVFIAALGVTLATACAPTSAPAAGGKAAPKVLVTETFLADIASARCRWKNSRHMRRVSRPRRR